MSQEPPSTRTRAAQSAGHSSQIIYDTVRFALERRRRCGGVHVDVGCGSGGLFHALQGCFARSIGVDLLQYEGFPPWAEFVELDLETGRVELPDGVADVVTCVETLEHVENPRGVVRSLLRLCRPGGVLVLTTPNQLNVMSLASLLLRGQFASFVEAPGLYPAHITALVEEDLRRIARENKLVDAEVLYSGQGRIPLTPRYWPGFLSSRTGLRGRLFSDNILISALVPE